MKLHHRPANAFVAGFTGSPSMSVLDAEVRGVAGERMRVANRALVPVRVGGLGERARLGVRP